MRPGPFALLSALSLVSLGGAIQQQSPLHRMRWLAGCWEQRRGNSVTLEMWMPPEGDLMLGVSRRVANGQVREYEQVRLAWNGDSLIYHAEPSGQPPADFTGSAPTDSGFTVANPAHDFPQRISYRRRGADSLVARIEGPGAGGTKGIDYPMKRVGCTAP
ncbi:MAG TPA: DUF6265 family protein [Gemmatimonadales bacterium]|nr:DUF6265 family protein [Gemmatimonadales bacterium]